GKSPATPTGRSPTTRRSPRCCWPRCPNCTRLATTRCGGTCPAGAPNLAYRTRGGDRGAVRQCDPGSGDPVRAAEPAHSVHPDSAVAGPVLVAAQGLLPRPGAGLPVLERDRVGAVGRLAFAQVRLDGPG